VLAHDVFAEARTLIDAEHAGNTARHRADRAADGRANWAGRCATSCRAALGAADDTLCIRRKRERRCKSRTSNPKLEPHSVSPRYFASGDKTRFKRKRSGAFRSGFRCAFAEDFRKCFNGL
jgi:hypothetical protein